MRNRIPHSTSFFFSQNDDEWLSYDDDKKDYSGLKIESLKVEERGGSEEEEEEHEINEEGEKVRVKRPEGGPWNKAAAGPKKDEDEAQGTPGSRVAFFVILSDWRN